MITERLVLEREDTPELIRLHVARYEFAREFVRGKSVLDVACGSGYGSAILKEAGAARVVGLDNSRDTIEYAKTHFQTEGIEFVVGIAEDLSLRHGFDVIVSFETIEHLQRPEAFLLEIKRSLAPQGRLIISTPRREIGTLRDRPPNPFHVREWSLQEFEALLSEYFHIEKSHGQYGFERKWFPYSRTLQRAIFKALYPGHFTAIDSYPVLAQPPRHKGFRFSLDYMVVLCTGKKL
jgi:SAM-dependent methyltransferase